MPPAGKGDNPLCKPYDLQGTTLPVNTARLEKIKKD